MRSVRLKDQRGKMGRSISQMASTSTVLDPTGKHEYFERMLQMGCCLTETGDSSLAKQKTGASRGLKKTVRLRCLQIAIAGDALTRQTICV